VEGDAVKKSPPQSAHLPRRHAALLALSLLLCVIACAIQGGSHTRLDPVPPQTWQKARGPVVPHDTFPRDCSLCHEGSSWHDIKDDFTFDHEKETGVPLEGAHAAAECLRCHNDRGPVAMFAQQGCAGCHEDVHRGKMGRNCVDCHVQTDWMPDEHVVTHARTRFPLVGSHAAVACFRCHPGADVGNFDRTPTECVDCHRDQIAQATSPDHVAQGFTTSCDRCHIPTTWDGAGFNHGAFFPLTGQHAVTACVQCHPNDVFAGTPTTCVGCHQADYDGARDPDHVQAGFPTTCDSCHSTSSWEGASFAHTAWPLTGSHVSTDCAACHKNGQFEGTPTACVACHQADFNGATMPDHVATGLPTTCELCHNTSSWRRADFRHQGVTNGCVDCHQADYQAARSPNHVALSFPTTCESCHQSTTTWDGASFNHRGVVSGCVRCHQGDYQSARSPNHVALNFPTTCENCHDSTRTWEGADFDHRGITARCITCHQSDFNSTTSPNHMAAGFPTTCQTCHTTRSWSGATFNHTEFPIDRGDHDNLTCQQCHQVPSNFGVFTCTNCHAHEAGEMNKEHDRVRGYTYNSNACYNCHPDGKED
jgi:hypothetical protein